MFTIIVGVAGIIVGVVFHKSISVGWGKAKAAGTEIVHEVKEDAKKVHL